MSKRALDIVLAALGLVLAAPLLAGAMLLVWLQDGRAPIYRAERVGRGGRRFAMLKLRTMRVGGEPLWASTARSDPRITPIGHWLRRTKIDELPQLWNVLGGSMSLVGPRPNTWRGGVERYTPEEMRLLTVRPGITDPASIVFSDEADILDGAADPDARYDAVIRPWKSRLGLLYVDRRSLGCDLRLLWLTALGLVARPAALARLDALLDRWRADAELRRICRRDGELPGAEARRLAA